MGLNTFILFGFLCILDVILMIWALSRPLPSLVVLGFVLLFPLAGGLTGSAAELDKQEAAQKAIALQKEIPGMTQQAKVWCEEHRIYPITLERARPPAHGAPWDFQVTYTDLEGVVRGVRITCPPGDRCYLAPGEGK